MTAITNHVERALNLLVSQFKETNSGQARNNIQKLIKCLVEQVQEIDNVNQQLLNQRSLNTALGVQLDKLGEILGLERQDGESDEDYRERLKFQAFINNSDGTPEKVINILKVITNATKVRYHELHPAAFQLTTDGSSFPNPVSQLIDLISSSSPAGVQYVPITATYGVFPFVFANDPTLNELAVVPDENNLTDIYNVEVDTGEIIQVNSGQFPTPSLNVPQETIGGWFSEAIWTNEPTTPIIYDFDNTGSGQLAEVIQG